MNLKKILLGSAAGTLMLGATVLTALAANYFNGFETDTDGWFNDAVEINRVSSGTNGVSSADGSFHAEVDAGAFTRWGGYESTFPVNGYVTQVDIYLNMSENPTLGTDKRFDFSSAINNPAGTHRRDFIFSVGTDPLVVEQFAMSASNNSPGWPSNPGRDPLFVSQSGWYTFRHTFQDNGSGILEVVMDVLDSSGTVLKTWTLSDPSDVIGSTVGGNRYGWFVTSGFDFLAIDNSEKHDVVERNAKITSPEDGETVSGMVDFTAFLTDDDPDPIQWAVRQGTCTAGVGTVFGNVDGHTDSATIDQSDLSNQTFEFLGDMSAMTPGVYCFVYNPIEDSGEANIREKVEFNLEAPEVLGCTDPEADNYDPEANTDDGSCTYSPVDKDACKNGGWEDFGFKNQGLCIQYVNTGKDSRL